MMKIFLEAITMNNCLSSFRIYPMALVTGSTSIDNGLELDYDD